MFDGTLLIARLSLTTCQPFISDNHAVAQFQLSHETWQASRRAHLRTRIRCAGRGERGAKQGDRNSSASQKRSHPESADAQWPRLGPEWIQRGRRETLEPKGGMEKVIGYKIL